tara:strand:+ start:22797 stop:23531 length:735 start_codon:yes stop_codon:yes gene_type:complete
MKKLRYSVTKWLVVSLLCLLFGFLLGKFKQDILNDTLKVMSVDLEIMKMRNSRLETDLARVDIIAVSDQQAIKSLMQSNKQLQDELAIANNKLHFYEVVISPELEITGVKIQSFIITPDIQTKGWNYELVLMQSQKGRRLLNGTVDISFSMFEEETIKEVVLAQFSEEVTNTFKFKYFQAIEGSFIVPDNVVIDEVIINLNVDGNRSYKAQNIEEHYDWRVLTDQGVDDLGELEQAENSYIDIE